MPTYVWACDQKLPYTSAEDLIVSALDEHHEDASSEVNRVMKSELQEFLDSWWADTKISSWDVDYDRAIVLAPSTFDKPDVMLAKLDRADGAARVDDE